MAIGRYDVVHAVEEAAHLAAPLARLLGCPARCRRGFLDSRPAALFGLRDAAGRSLWLAEALERHALRRSAAVVTVCTSLTEGVRARAPAAAVFQVEDPPLVDGVALDPSAGATPAPGARARPRCRSSSTRATSSPTRACGCSWMPPGWCPRRSFLFMGGEPAEIAALQGARHQQGAADRCVFAGKRPPSELPAFLALADVLVSPRHQGREHAVQDLHLPRLGQAARGHPHPHPHAAPRRLARLPGGADARRAGGGNPRRRSADPAEAQARATRGRALIDREYSPARYTQKVAQAYSVIAGLVGARQSSS